MTRLHVHVSVPELEASIRYYSTLFAASPDVVKPDYAKWSLADPAVNFAISARAEARDGFGVDHLGIEVDDEAALAGVTERLERAQAPALGEAGARCCYARSEKTWSRDPAGVIWETFYTHGETATYGATRPEVAGWADDAEASGAAGCGCR